MQEMSETREPGEKSDWRGIQSGPEVLFLQSYTRHGGRCDIAFKYGILRSESKSL